MNFLVEGRKGSSSLIFLNSASTHSQLSSCHVESSLFTVEKKVSCVFLFSHSIIVKMKIEIECWQEKALEAFVNSSNYLKTDVNFPHFNLGWMRDLFYVQFSCCLHGNAIDENFEAGKRKLKIRIWKLFQFCPFASSELKSTLESWSHLIKKNLSHHEIYTLFAFFFLIFNVTPTNTKFKSLLEKNTYKILRILIWSKSVTVERMWKEFFRFWMLKNCESE